MRVYNRETQRYQEEIYGYYDYGKQCMVEAESLVRLMLIMNAEQYTGDVLKKIDDTAFKYGTYTYDHSTGNGSFVGCRTPL